MKNMTVFGYGSLINQGSLVQTVPDATNIKPGIVQGYKRTFGRRARHRMNKDGLPISVLTLKEDSNSLINGVMFNITPIEVKLLQARETEYDLEKVIINGLDGQSYAGYIFIYKHNDNQPFLYGDPTQIDYLTVCLIGASKLGNDFYNQFLQTTFIDDHRLVDVGGLNK